MIELLSHSEDVLRSRLLSEQLSKSADEWARSRLWHFWYQPIVHASLTEQRMGAIFDRVGFKQPVKAQALARRPQQSHQEYRKRIQQQNPVAPLWIFDMGMLIPMPKPAILNLT
jgi:hypothetical protein